MNSRTVAMLRRIRATSDEQKVAKALTYLRITADKNEDEKRAAIRLAARTIGVRDE